MFYFQAPTKYGLHRKIFMTNSMKNFISILIHVHYQKMLNVISFSPQKVTDCYKIGGGHVTFCNPPYGRKLYEWVEKCYNESKKPNTTVVMLIPARTDTRYFHEFIYHKAKEIRFIRGRLKFGESKNSAPFPSMVIIF